MLDSVHTARWLGQFEGEDVEFVLFPSTPNRQIHSQIRGYLQPSSNIKLKIPFGLRVLSLPTWIIDFLCFGKIRKRMLQAICTRNSFDFAHALETQHGGYLLADSLKKLVDRPTFILTLWGSDLNWFQHDKKHQLRIINVLKDVDLLSTECVRDQDLARGFGFQGRFLPRIPASGGINRERVGTLSLPSTRNAIAVKGYSGFVGKSLEALAALKRNEELVRRFEVHVYSASLRTRLECTKLRRTTGLTVYCHKKKSLTVDQMIQIFSQSRISLSLSLSDGFPGSQREAMSVGCFPIESCGSCASEWVKDSSHIAIVNPLRPSTVDEAILAALTDDELVDRASIANQDYILNNLEYKQTALIARSFYKPNSLSFQG
jgi:glycosyltransferase involved in cell wall biosynthesis